MPYITICLPKDLTTTAEILADKLLPPHEEARGFVFDSVAFYELFIEDPKGILCSSFKKSFYFGFRLFH